MAASTGLPLEKWVRAVRLSSAVSAALLSALIVTGCGSPPTAIAEVEDTDMIDVVALSADQQVDAPEAAPLTIVDLDTVRQLTGAASPNATDRRWNVHGTDLGHMFRHKDDLYMVFGDTYGPDGGDWRSNTIARMADPDPAGGFAIANMIEGADGTAKEVIRSAKIPGVEWTVIPTNGVSLGERMVLHYMSVRMWGADDKWYVRRSGLAYSDDDGQNWTRSDTAVWPAGSGFEQVAYVKHDDMIYIFGIPQGRFGGVRLGRVVPQDVFDPGAYTYWDGQRWSTDIRAARDVVAAPAGELSVAWNAQHRAWLMMYLDPVKRAIVLRSAASLTGPWSDPQVVAHADSYPGLYAPYIVPTSAADDAIYFTMSRWKPVYNVFLMKGRVQALAADRAEAEPVALEPSGD
ncbi:DUF4185 domain-containing protein [Jannaschia marina]|uniref:DUF4185 domain-containing protein n=1 Tax=Jannaschia marina TaxID=2741674 RepID=UPI0015C9E8D7|nr:DUF4185 domain-containing protein [Jannaschia marina]